MSPFYPLYLTGKGTKNAEFGPHIADIQTFIHRRLDVESLTVVRDKGPHLGGSVDPDEPGGTRGVQGKDVHMYTPRN